MKYIAYKCLKECLKEWGGYFITYLALQLIFIVLKIANIVPNSWGWSLVLFPLWIVGIIVIAFIVSFFQKYFYYKGINQKLNDQK